MPIIEIVNSKVQKETIVYSLGNFILKDEIMTSTTVSYT